MPAFINVLLRIEKSNQVLHFFCLGFCIFFPLFGRVTVEQNNTFLAWRRKREREREFTRSSKPDENHARMLDHHYHHHKHCFTGMFDEVFETIVIDEK